MDERRKAMIEKALETWGYKPDSWREDDEMGPVAVLGRARVMEDDDTQGILEDDMGELTACVVGAQQYDNEQVAFHIKLDDMALDSHVEPHQVELV